MIASLPMYDWPEIRQQTDIFWARFVSQLSNRGIEAPTQLQRDETHLHWHSKTLFLSQTCIFPLVTELPPSTVVLGTPTYEAPFSKDGRYASVLLIRKSGTRDSLNAMRGATLAYNAANSQSGFNALRNHLLDTKLVTADKPYFFSKAVCTGSHRRSAESVASGAADLCAVDPISWLLLQKHDPHIAKDLAILSSTSFSPALPLICHASTIPKDYSEQQWRGIIQNAFSSASKETDLGALHINGIADIPTADYFELVISDIDVYHHSVTI